MIVRKATLEDIPSLSDLAARTFYQAYGWYNTAENMRNYIQQYFSEPQLKIELEDPESTYLIAQNDSFLGYVKLGKQQGQKLLNNDSHSEIERIYVDDSIQRAGIGKLMLDAVIKIARERGNHYLWLGVWQKNEKAIAFYTKNGFEVIGTTQFVLGDDVQDDFIMALKI